jgi:hypothetical protein
MGTGGGSSSTSGSGSATSGSSGSGGSSTGGNQFCGGAARGLDFKAAVTHATTPGPWFLSAGDIVGNDGFRDLVVSSSNGPQMQVVRNTFGGIFMPDTVVDLAGTEMTRASAIGDFNGDAIPDLAITTREELHVFSGTNATSLGSATVFSFPGANLWGVAAANVFDASEADVVTVGPQTVRFQIGSANGLQAYDPSNSFDVGSDLGQVVLGDIDGVGKPDLVVADNNESGASWGIHVVTNLEDLGIAPITPTYYTTSPYPWGLALGDVVGDDRLDVIVTHATMTGTDPTDVLVFGNVAGALELALTFQVDGSGSSPRVADLDCDGIADFAVGTVDGVVVFLGDGNGSFTTESIPVGGVVGGLLLDDLNDDGRPDLTVSVFNQAEIAIRIGN